MSEEPIVFGPDRNLVGMLTRPGCAGRADVACVMLNMGVTHRVGPHRINVKLARELARQGLPSLRFDLSGIGDSAPARHPADFRTQAIRDLQSAMDAVEAGTGVRRFLVFGLCSGAMHAYSVALADSRVVGLYLFDGYAFTSKRVRWSRNWHRLLAMPTNPAIAAKTWRWLRRALRREQEPEIDIFADEAGPDPTAQEYADQLQTLHRRGVDLLLAYSATLHAVDRGQDQLSAVAGHPVLSQLRYEFLPDVDHTLLPVAAQRRLIASVTSWIGRSAFAQASAGAAHDRASRAPFEPDAQCAAHDL